MALALGEDRHQHVGAGDFLAARGLDMDGGALDHALEAGGRLRIADAVADEAGKLVVDVAAEITPQAFSTAVASASSSSDSSRCSSVAYSCRRSFARRSARCRLCSRFFDNMLETPGARAPLPYSFSSVHCSGC
jgi:hypothetical protein